MNLGKGEAKVVESKREGQKSKENYDVAHGCPRVQVAGGIPARGC